MRKIERKLKYKVKRKIFKRDSLGNLSRITYLTEEKAITYLPSGLARVHIGENQWAIGIDNYIDTPEGKKLHAVIYGPDNKEFHVYEDDVRFIKSGTLSNKKNHTDLGALKVYILTSILDDKENWVFDIHETLPAPGNLKVIYSNGTVQNVLFYKKYPTFKSKPYRNENIVVAYRKQHI